jgi:hypothetical protein
VNDSSSGGRSAGATGCKAQWPNVRCSTPTAALQRATPQPTPAFAPAAPSSTTESSQRWDAPTLPGHASLAMWRLVLVPVPKRESAQWVQAGRQPEADCSWRSAGCTETSKAWRAHNSHKYKPSRRAMVVLVHICCGRCNSATTQVSSSETRRGILARARAVILSTWTLSADSWSWRPAEPFKKDSWWQTDGQGCGSWHPTSDVRPLCPAAGGQLTPASMAVLVTSANPSSPSSMKQTGIGLCPKLPLQKLQATYKLTAYGLQASSVAYSLTYGTVLTALSSAPATLALCCLTTATGASVGWPMRFY